MPITLDGRVVRAARKQDLMEKVKQSTLRLGREPKLVIIQVGNRPDSTLFIKAKKKFATEIGVKELHVELPEEVSEKDLISKIKEHNSDPSVDGIIVQLPLPEKINKKPVIDAISPEKDVDGLSSKAIHTPATARGIGELLDYYHIDLSGKKVTVIGRSDLVGKPVAGLCRGRGAIVTVCHSETIDVPKETKDAEVIITATGVINLVNERHVSSGQVIIDVGIPGDVDKVAVGQVIGESGAMSPVPGGVGQMTVLALFENLIDACYNRK